MKLRPVVSNDLPVVEWRFKKHKVSGKIKYRVQEKDYIYILEHPSFNEKCSLEEGKTFKTLESAKDAAEKWIDFWDYVQGRIMSFGAF